MATKVRLDHLMVQRSLAESRSQAQALVLAGLVRVNGQVVSKPGTRVPADAELTVDQPLPYVSRGGLKLAAALDAFDIPVVGAICADVGASTGGFTDCLLQRGAARVYAIDVGYGQLAWKLRQDERVVVLERTNARYLQVLPEPINLVVLDVSFISLRLLLPVIAGWLAPAAHVVPLIKPQFETERRHVGKGGVVRDPNVHRQVLESVAEHAREQGLAIGGLIRSPITGPAGNVEFLMHLQSASPHPDFDLSRAIDRCLSDDTALGQALADVGDVSFTGTR